MSSSRALGQRWLAISQVGRDGHVVMTTRAPVGGYMQLYISCTGGCSHVHYVQHARVAIWGLVTAWPKGQPHQVKVTVRTSA